jgi:hypothetical protein
LIVTEGLYTSSNKYNSRIEGNPINKRIIAGTTVQNNSNDWDSNIITLTFLLDVVLNKLKPTIEIIKIKIVIAWL